MAKKAAKESIERIHKIVRLIRRRGSASLPALKSELEVHPSTIKRDINVLRDRLGCPLDYDPHKKGYVIRDDQLPGGGPFELPGLWFNPSEVYALLTTLHLLRGMQPGLLEPHIEPLRARLNSLLKGSAHSVKSIERRVKLIHFGGRRVEAKHFEAVVGAVLERKRISMRYLNRDKQELTERQVSPLQLVHYRHNWWLDAWCHMRDGIRTFALDAIQQLAILDKQAIDVSDEKLAAHFRSGYGMYAGPATQRAKLKFSPQRAQYVSLEKWHRNQTASTLPDGSYVIEIPYSLDPELLEDVLRHGPEVEVLEPPELRRRVAGALCAAARKYGTDLSS